MINPTSNFNGYNRMDALSGSNAKPASASKQEASTPAGGERLSSSSTDALREALNNTPEVRADVVARGKALAVDPTYPPREIIERLSELMLQSREPAAE